LVAAAARLCYSPASARDLAEVFLDEGRVRPFLEKLRRSGHLSTFEHASFSFAVDGISRVCSHQLVRHRLASYSQQSQRYVSQEKAGVVMPRSIREHPRAREVFEEAVAQTLLAYGRLGALGIPREDARYVLPHGGETRMMVTMNARELLHFFRLRLCRRAQWEIRDLAREMLRLVREVAPGLFAVAGPGCVETGACGEDRPCGRPFVDTEDVLAHAVD
jgi:thymidylate synthase (FAD)